MTALALNGRPLNSKGKLNLPMSARLRRFTMGPLERCRLKAVLAQAEQAGIKGSIPDTLRDPRLIGMLARQFKVPAPSIDACQRFYREHAESFRQADRYLGRQIVLRCSKSDTNAWAEAWARAERLIAILFFDPKMFGDLVATYDSISDGSGSGRIGPVVRGELPAELDMALFGLHPGQIYPAPVGTGQGIHVVVLDRVLPGEIMPFAGVYGRIGATLKSQLRRAAALRHLSRLAERYSAAAAE